MTPAATRSKSAILQRLQSVQVPECDLPKLDRPEWITYEDPVAKLVDVIRFVGGECKLLDSYAAIEDDLKSYAEFQAAKQIWSNTDHLPGNVDLETFTTPHELDHIDFAIYNAEIAVAENGAVWVSDKNIKHRVVFFIAQHLILIVPRSGIVDNLYQAYKSIDIDSPGFNCWISGPSKTADIEQSLVIGAHGCRSMILYILG